MSNLPPGAVRAHAEFLITGSLNASRLLAALIMSLPVGTTDAKNTLYAAYWYIRATRSAS